MTLTLPKFSIWTAACTFFLIIAGALVTSTGSGLSVPDWPLSFGTFFPRMDGGVLFEHGHRMAAGAVGIMTFVLSAWLWKSEPRRWLCWLGTSAAAAVLLQALLGGLTVLMKLPPQVSIAHAVLAQAFFCLTVALAFYMNRPYRHALVRARTDSLNLLSLSATVLLFIQLALGAALRHFGSPKFLYLHATLAGTAAVLNFALLYRTWPGRRDAGSLFRPALAVSGLILAQICLGLLSIFPSIIALDMSWLARTMIVTAHVAVGALILAASLFATLKSMEPA